MFALLGVARAPLNVVAQTVCHMVHVLDMAASIEVRTIPQL